MSGDTGGRPRRAGFLWVLSAHAGNAGPVTYSQRAADPDGARTGIRAHPRPDWVELVFCLAAFAVLCVFALSTHRGCWSRTTTPTRGRLSPSPMVT